jgi:hypothetical protein
MLTRIIIKLFVLLHLTVVSVSAEKIKGSDFYSGAWAGSAYVDNTTGEFWYCSIYANYGHNNTQLNFYLNKNYTMTIGVYDNLGRFPVGQGFPVTLYVDRRPPFYGTANSTDANNAFVTLNQMDAALNAMKRGNFLTIEGLYGSLKYQLNGTFKALDSAYNCARNYYNYKTAVKDTDNNSQKSNNWIPTREQERTMFQLASAIATDLGQSKIEFRDSTNGSVIWDSADKSMWVSAAVGRNQGQEVDLAFEFGLDMGNLNDWCDGDLATIQREYTVSGVETTETDAQCHSASGGTKFKTHIIRQIVDGELYELVLFLDGKVFNDAKSRSNPDQNIAKAAATILASYSSD